MEGPPKPKNLLLDGTPEAVQQRVDHLLDEVGKVDRAEQMRALTLMRQQVEAAIGDIHTNHLAAGDEAATACWQPRLELLGRALTVISDEASDLGLTLDIDPREIKPDDAAEPITLEKALGGLSEATSFLAVVLKERSSDHLQPLLPDDALDQLTVASLALTDLLSGRQTFSEAAVLSACSNMTRAIGRYGEANNESTTVKENQDSLERVQSRLVRLLDTADHLAELLRDSERNEMLATVGNFRNAVNDAKIANGTRMRAFEELGRKRFSGS